MNDRRIGFIIGAVLFCTLAMYLWGVSSLIAPQLAALRTAHKLLGSWGGAVLGAGVLNWVLVKGLQVAGASSDKLRALQPQIAAIQQRYAVDRELREMQLLELYQREGLARPALWLIPWMMPVTIWLVLAMYAALWRLPELRGASWLWISDLSARDPRYLLPIGSVLLSVLGWLMRPTDASAPRHTGLTITLVFACVAFLLPASFVLYGCAYNVLSTLVSMIPLPRKR